MTDKYSHIPVIKDTIDPEPNKSGVQGYGEGLVYGTESMSRGDATYYYRFAGKRIPREGLAYVTNESNYFSRIQGDRQQLIVAFDKEVNGFRVLAKTSSEQGNFKETFNKLKALGSLENILTHIQHEAEKEAAIAAELQAALDRGDDLF